MQLTQADWQQVERYYPHLQQRCIELQDQYQVNINLLLLAYYLDKQQLGLSLTCWRSLQQQTTQFESQLLTPFRQLRRQNKTVLSAIEYQQMLKLELVFERKLQTLISTWLEQQLTTSSTQNMDHYLAIFGLNRQQFPA